MAKYSIDDSTLVALGDALRAKTSEEKDGPIYTGNPTGIIKSANALTEGSFFPENMGMGPSYWVVNAQRITAMSNVAKINIKLSYQTVVLDFTVAGGTIANVNMCIFDKAYSDSILNSIEPTIICKSSNAEISRAEYEINSNEITLALVLDKTGPSGVTSSVNAYFYAEVEFFDSDGKHIDYYTIGKVKNTMTPSTMITTINELATNVPDSAFQMTGYVPYRCAYDNYTWMIDLYGDKITTKNLTTATNMFMNSYNLTKVPFQLNFGDNQAITLTALFKNCNNLTQIDYDITVPKTSYDYQSAIDDIFSGCYKLESIPYIYNVHPSTMNNMFKDCQRLRYVPDDYIDTWKLDKMLTYQYAYIGHLFDGCYSLREVPKWLSQFQNMKTTSTSSLLYAYLFQHNYSLNEIIDLPVLSAITITSNVFGYTFKNCYRLKNLTFKLNDDGTPQTVKWAKQTIDLASVGSLTSERYVLDYNSGITADKKVVNDETYQALKNDPDWYAVEAAYSRYNHDSAVATINSLPDSSAYNTNNTIKFNGLLGSATDGGAVSTLTEEEIAVAAAKGWTVSII